jgi:phosphoglycerate dehydrogenase-like enzyme
MIDAVVLATPRSFGAHDPSLKSELEGMVKTVRYLPSPGMRADELIPLVGDVDGWIAGLDEITRSVIAAAPRLKVIARYGVGTEQVDLEAARERGIVVTNTPGANADAVAELTIAFVLALARRITAAERSARAGIWSPVRGLTVAGRSIGLVGLGAVGRAVAIRARALGCRVLAREPAPDTEFAASHGIELVELDELLSRADFVSLHVPLLPETRGMVNEAFLERMKPGSFLINTARGELIDESALVQAVTSGHLAGVALDTLAQEPPPTDAPLLHLDTVIVTPHIGAHTDGATNAMGRAALRDCLAVLAGRSPEYPVLPTATEARR